MQTKIQALLAIDPLENRFHRGRQAIGVLVELQRGLLEVRGGAFVEKFFVIPL